MERIKWVDNLKGFILLLVCIGHVHFKGGLFANIHIMSEPFWMPGFFFLSGYLFSDKKYQNFGSYLKTKARSLLVPYFCLSVIFSFIDIRLYNVSLIPYHQYTDYPILAFMGVPASISNSLQYLYLEIVNIFVAGASTPITTPLWFVNVLFWASLLFYLVKKLSTHIGEGKYPKIFIFLFACFMLGLGWIYSRTRGFLPFNFHVVFTASFFVSIGYIAKDFIKNKLFQLSSPLLVCVLILLSILYLYGININGAYHLYTNTLGSSFYGFLISSLSGISMIIVLFILLSRIPKTSVIGGIFRNLARNALIFLAVHYWVIITCDVVFHKYAHLPAYKYSVLLAAIIISVLSFPIFRNKLYKLLGKEKISMKESLSLK